MHIYSIFVSNLTISVLVFQDWCSWNLLEQLAITLFSLCVWFFWGTPLISVHEYSSFGYSE